jgi:hypothetical protein
MKIISDLASLKDRQTKVMGKNSYSGRDTELNMFM